MVKKIIAAFLTAVTLLCCVGICAFAKVSVPDVKNFHQTAATSSSVTMKWDKVKKAKGYLIYIYDSKSKKYKKLTYCYDTDCKISSLSSAKKYSFKIKSYVLENGKRVFCKNYTKAGAVTAPGKVTDLKITSKKADSFVLSWKSVKNASGYIVQRLNAETDEWKTYKTVTDTSLKIKSEGKYRVVAYKLSGTAKYRSSASSSIKGAFKYVYSEKGTFTFTVYGYGHGVGMSQNGADYYACNSGWSYKKILTHYYSGTKIVKDENPPKKVKYGDKKYPLDEYLYRVTQAEIGDRAHVETIKAQAIACYSYAKYYKFSLSSSSHAFSDMKKVTDKVKDAVDAVMGKYVSYDGDVCLTPYFSISAGKTAACEKTWGGKLSYLSPVSSSADRKNQYWKSTYTVSSEDFKESFLEDYEEELKGDPSKWIKIVSHDTAVSSSIGYVSEIKVGTVTMRGDKFRSSVMHRKIRSHCFTVSYKAD